MNKGACRGAARLLPLRGTNSRAVASTLVLVLAATLSTDAKPTSAKRVKKHKQEGLASWYGPGFHGKPTASGEIFDMHGLTAAHRTLPLGTLIEVHNLENGRTTVARVNDRGPHKRGRIVDLSLGAAEELGIERSGVARVRLTVVREAMVEASDYWVQVGAFQSESNARAMLADIERRYPDAEIEVESGWYQVRVPSGAKKRAAETLERRLQRAGYDTVLVRQPRSKK
jgi:rare lipoprotein A